MSGMIHQEADFLLVSLLWGVGMTAVYDCLRILRTAVRHASAVVAAEDFLYWIFATFALFVLLFSMNDGNLRWYALAGAGAGMWLYHITLSPFLVKWLGKALEFAIKGLAFPLKILGRLLKKRLRWLTIKIRTKGRAVKAKHAQEREHKKESVEGDRGGKHKRKKIQKTEQDGHSGNPSGDSPFLRTSFLQDEDIAGQGQQIRSQGDGAAGPDRGGEEKSRRIKRAGSLRADQKIHRRNRKDKAGTGKSRRNPLKTQ
jgi:spore cortex biosynthesis protein YabQ